jgi:hypothetical protein
MEQGAKRRVKGREAVEDAMLNERESARDVKLPPQSLIARLEAAAAKRDADGDVPAPASMAERFAPEAAATPARRGGPAGNVAASRLLLAAMAAAALVPSLALTALYWHDRLELPGWLAAAKVLPDKAPLPPSQPRTLAASLVPPETVQAKRDAERPEIVLTLAETLAGQAGKETPFPIALDSDDSLPYRSIVSLHGLPAGATLSAGRPYGETEWSLRPDEIGDLTITLPPEADGEHEVSVTLVSADGRTLASGTTRLDIAPDPRAALIVRPNDTARIDELIAHGRKMIDVGYLAGARGYYKRAAEAGSAEAALALGDTFDPGFIAGIGAHGIRPEPGEARNWYERAKLLGSPAASARLAELDEELSAPREKTAPAESASATPSSALTAGTQAEAAAEWVEIASPVNVRAEPTPEGETLKIAQRGTRYKAIGRKGRWVQITDPKTAEVGWVYSRFIASAGEP